MTSRPLYLSGIAQKCVHAGQQHLKITALHGKGKLAQTLLTSVSQQWHDRKQKDGWRVKLCADRHSLFSLNRQIWPYPRFSDKWLRQVMLTVYTEPIVSQTLESSQRYGLGISHSILQEIHHEVGVFSRVLLQNKYRYSADINVGGLWLGLQQ